MPTPLHGPIPKSFRAHHFINTHVFADDAARRQILERIWWVRLPSIAGQQRGSMRARARGSMRSFT